MHPPNQVRAPLTRSQDTTRGWRQGARAALRAEGAVGGGATLRPALDSRSALLGGVAQGNGEGGYYDCARENRQDEPSFGLPVRFKLRGKRTIGKVLEFATPDELGESRSPDAIEVSGARAPQRFIRLGVTRGERLREIAPSPD